MLTGLALLFYSQFYVSQCTYKGCRMFEWNKMTVRRLLDGIGGKLVQGLWYHPRT